MRYAKRYEEKLKTRHWKSLWESNIPDLATLKSQVESRGIIVVDAEPWNAGGSFECREFGIAYIPPIQSTHNDDMGFPRTLKAHQKHYGIQSHCVHIRSRERSRCGQAFEFGEVDLVNADLVEEKLLGIIESFNASPESVLVGFDLSFELRVLSIHYPRLLEWFSSWVDVQELAADASGHPRMPSLRDTMIALGFGGDRHAVGSHINWGHCAGNDVVRLAAGLIELMRRPESSPPLNIGQSQKKSSKQKI
ncbi:hypothetical protein N8I77_006643 [Diaporthe amygdali]|uniref:Gfd2/YDR514C-like C-terminal domain-containing protein n=1 Tax=Phomopsis amygdali TaxID=1214568 RepID=A0AAD9W6S9_PHOAM|nr:hypothetical protein N8I77_006643 [Diaporthe amygdali]